MKNLMNLSIKIVKISLIVLFASCTTQTKYLNQDVIGRTIPKMNKIYNVKFEKCGQNICLNIDNFRLLAKNLNTYRTYIDILIENIKYYEHVCLVENE